MKTINRRIVALGLATALVTGTGATLAFAGHKGQHGCDRSGRGGPMAALEQLDGLTTEQKTQLEQIRNQTRDAMRDLREAMRDGRDDLRTAMVDGADIETITELAEKQGAQKTRMIVLRAQTRNQINDVLTGEQQQQLAEMRASNRHERQYFRGKRDF
ncbi:MAG: Spy/CpxP family protein refolding chaperone [Gammaproteobacteria bacterium]|nr:Spy/CpxP family protein refolding chaperone [Gammaproteobacteria bacterium]